MRSQSIAPMATKLEEIYDREEEDSEEETETGLSPRIQKAIDEGIDEVFGKN